VTDALPPVVAIMVALLLVLGAGIALIGSFGLLRLGSFYERVHPPTMGTTLGVGCTVAASILFSSWTEPRLAVSAVLVAVFAFVTTPVTFMLLVRAALHRDVTIPEQGPAGPGSPSVSASND